MAVKRTGLGKGLDSMIPPKATQSNAKSCKRGQEYGFKNRRNNFEN